MSRSFELHRNSHEADFVPKKQEWALLNQQKALELERTKQIERLSTLEKKIKLKHELDQQLNSKMGNQYQEKEANRRYYQYLSRKAEESQEKEDRQKVDKFFQRRKIDEENQTSLLKIKDSRVRDHDSGYHLDIGIKSEVEHKRKDEHHKKEMLDTLDQQVKIKAEEKKFQQMYNLHLDNSNMQYQYNQFDRRNIKNKRYGQNENVYKYFRELDQQKTMKEKELDHLLVEEAGMKQREEEDKKNLMKQQQKNYLTNQMKQTLNKQVENHQWKAEQERRSNPEEASYAVIGNLFREKPSPYNKKEYSEYLRRQAEEQSSRRMKDKFMSEEEYRINMNQLNRAVSGDYANKKYIDRSIAAIGETTKFTQVHEAVRDEDTNVVQKKLENVKNKSKLHHDFEQLAR